MNQLKKIKNYLSRQIKRFTTASLKQKIVITTVVAVVLFILFNQYKKTTRRPNYRTEPVARGKIVETVTETGNMSSSGTRHVTTATSGVVKAVYVKNGNLVKAGDKLVELTLDETGRQKQSAALAAYLSAKNAFETAKATQYSLQADMFKKWDTFKELAESDDYETGDGKPRYENRALPEFHTPEKEWLAAEAKYKTQIDAVNATTSSLSSYYTLYQQTLAVLTAPIDGTVANLSITEGDIITPQTTSAALPFTAVTITNLSGYYIKLQLNEVDIPKVQTGQKATVKLDAFPSTLFSGMVDRVDNVGTNTGGVITYNVYAKLTDPNPAIKPEMTATVEIETQVKTNTLLVPNSAVKPYQGGKAVQVINPKTKLPKFVPIKTGLRNAENTEVVSGIEEGTYIITALTNEQLNRPVRTPFNRGE